MAYYLYDQRHVRHLTGGLRMPHESDAIVGLRRSRPMGPGPGAPRRGDAIIGLRPKRSGVVGLRHLGCGCDGLAGGRIVDKSDPAESDISKVDGKPLQSDCAAALRAMQDAAYRDGIRSPLLALQSGYRAGKLQEKLFAKAVKKYGSVAKARKWVAPPGESAHQSGCALDLFLGIPMGTSPEKIRALRGTKAYAWLVKNAPRFGFAPYDAEPWHWECDAECRAQARAKWGGTANRAKMAASHAVDIAKANPVKSGLGVAAAIGIVLGGLFLMRSSRAAA